MKILNTFLAMGLLIISCSTPQTEKETYESKILLKAITYNVLGEKINFPDSNAAITSAIRVLPKGESTGIHMHEGIPVVFMLDGEITISHQTDSGTIEKIVKKGEAFVGATNNWHEATTTSDVDAVAQVVFIGSTDLKNTINKE